MIFMKISVWANSPVSFIETKSLVLPKFCRYFGETIAKNDN